MMISILRTGLGYQRLEEASRPLRNNLEFYQDDYVITMDIARIIKFNTSFYKYAKADFVLYNRTQRVFNASWDQIADLKSDMMLDIQVYKFTSNEYRFFPITVRVNVCTEFTKNTPGVRDGIFKHTNINPCNLKPGIYYVYNGLQDSSKLPPHLPRGSYKMMCTFTFNSYLLYISELYDKIKDKPVDWKNIPVRKWG